MASRWLSVRDLFEDGTKSLRKPKPAPTADEPLTKPAKGQAAQVPAALPTAEPALAKKPEPAVSRARMSEFEHDEPSLSSRARPELGGAADRHKAFSDAYNDPKARTHTKDRELKIRKNRGGVNVSFRGALESGHRFIAKPHAGAAWGFEHDAAGNEIPDDDRPNYAAAYEPDEWHRRHGAVYDVMSAMGAHHMVPVGIKSKIHDNVKETLAPDDSDPSHKRMGMAWSHAGGDSHVQEHVGNHEAVSTASAKDLAKVDDEHRLHGMVAHALFGNRDGHRENVLIHETGHPILIDHDLSLSSHYSKEFDNGQGGKSLKSVFAPGGLLDYRANRSEDVGMNYPPRMKKTLEWIASGGHTKGKDAMDLSKDDARELQDNAKSLLANGLEGHLSSLKIHTGGAAVGGATKASDGGEK